MVVFLRLVRVTLSPLVAVCLSVVGCGPDEGTRVSPETGDIGGQLVDICTMLDSSLDRGSGHDCEPYRIVSVIEPGRLEDLVRDKPVTHGLGDDPVDGGRRFSGADGDVVLATIGADESDLFNPGGGRFAFQAWLTLDRRELDALRSTRQPSWNVVQRGFADSPGGQWKMSLVTVDGQVQAQCVVRDAAGEVLRVHSRYRFQPDAEVTISCLFDDVVNELSVVVNRQGGDRDRSTDSGRPFGDVAPRPSGSDCRAEAAGLVAVGNKPSCGSTGPTDEDRFQGTIRQVRILADTVVPLPAPSSRQ
ncbi:MAG: hypothetical protein OER95_03170 [Acidimicrobiia bacterium]|nr:hypothetical protein [Acidimicrobiia bacterium]